MASNFNISVVGDKALQRKLNRLGKTGARRAIKDAMRKALAPLVPVAKGRAPKDTGRLAQNIKVKNLKAGRGQIAIGITTPTRKQLRISKNDKYYYPAALELGAKRRGIKAQKWLRRVMLDNERKILKKVGVELRKSITVEFRRP